MEGEKMFENKITVPIEKAIDDVNAEINELKTVNIIFLTTLLLCDNSFDLLFNIIAFIL